jgi:cytoskeletal protein CcmA (bactofilin family)
MWSTKKPNSPEAVTLEQKSLLANKKSNGTIHSMDSKADPVTGWLGSTMYVKGDISGTEDLLIDGSVEGMIQLQERKLTVGTAAKVTADIIAHDVVVYGYVKGNVRATGRIEIKKNGSVIGNLMTAQVLIEDGADFKGSIEIERGAKEEADRNVSARAASAGAGPV